MIRVRLSSAAMGDATEADFDAWALYVEDYIADACGFAEVDVDQAPFGEAGEDIVSGATDEQAEAIRSWLSHDGWDAFCAADPLAALVARASVNLATERDLSLFLIDAAKLAADFDPCLSLLLSVLADEPGEVAGSRYAEVRTLADHLHPDTDGPAIARAAALALEQWSPKVDAVDVAFPRDPAPVAEDDGNGPDTKPATEVRP